MGHPGVAVFTYHLTCYRRVWRGSVLGSFLTPVLLFLGIGVAVGRYVDHGGVLDLPYVQVFGPGLLVFTGAQIALLESSGPVMGKLSGGIYHVMATAPMRIGDLVAGQLGYIALRIGVAATAVLVVMVPFGAARSAWAVVTPLIAILVGLAVAAPVFGYAATIDNLSLLMVTLRFAMLPMTFLSGMFFPVERLPAGLPAVAYLLPVWHGVELSRAAAVGVDTAWPAAVHLGYLGLWIAGGFMVARFLFRRRLTP